MQGVRSSLTQQLLSLCKQFLVYPFNYHLGLLSVPTLSLNPLGEGQEAARTRSFLPPESPWCGSEGEDLKTLSPHHVLPLRRFLFAFMNQNPLPLLNFGLSTAFLSVRQCWLQNVMVF